MNGSSEVYPTQGQTGTASSWSLKAITGGSMAEAVGGVAAIVLAILALVGIIPRELVPIATIVIGAAFFCEGGTMAAAYRRTLSRGTAGGGITVEFLAGLAGIVLGILALFLNLTTSLLGAALIVLGAAMLLSIRLPGVTSEAASTPDGSQVLIGLAAVVLGILALAGLGSMVLIEVGLLCLGVGVLTAGTFHGLSRA